MRWLLAAGAMLALAACGDVRPATRLALHADVIELLTDDCPLAAIAPIKVGIDGDAMVFEDLATGAPVSILWPVGFVAWNVEGVATLHARDGTVVGRDGDTLANIRGLTGVRGDALRVCAVGTRTYR